MRQLRGLAGVSRGLGRPLTQNEVSQLLRKELGGAISQSYLSQIEKGSRPHLTNPTRLLLARFFRVHPGYLVDDLEGSDASLTPKMRSAIYDQLDLWLIDGSEEFRVDPPLSSALLVIAKHPDSRRCLMLLASLVEHRELLDQLYETVPAAPLPASRPRKKRRTRP